MKIGDLIKMSAAGRKTDQNSKAVGGWGVITHIDHDRLDSGGRTYPYCAKWFKDGEHFNFRFSRYEIKRLRADKK